MTAHRSARTGKYVTAKAAKRAPATTVREKRTRSRQVVAELERIIGRLHVAISWIAPPFVDDSTSPDELRSRVSFVLEDAERAMKEYRALARKGD